MLAYRPDSFASLYTTPLGQNIWEFLNREESVAQLETASDLGKSAVEGISEVLLESFGSEVLSDRVKQMIGHMTRQIMEQHGWEMDPTPVRILGVPFSKGARYKRPNAFLLHAFRNAKDPRDFVLTLTRQPDNLPSGTEWRYQAKITTRLQATVAYGVTSVPDVLDEIQQSGFYRIRVERILNVPTK